MIALKRKLILGVLVALDYSNAVFAFICASLILAQGAPGAELFLLVAPIKVLALVAVAFYSDQIRAFTLQSHLKHLLAAFFMSTSASVFIGISELSATPNLIVLDALIFTFLLLISRLTFAAIGQYLASKSHRALIVGTGPIAQQVAEELISSNKKPVEIAGFLSIGKQKPEAKTKVLGGIAELQEVVEGCHISEVIVAVPNLSSKKLREIAFACRAASVKLRHLGHFTTLYQQPKLVQHAREVRVEDLLLGRDAVALNNFKIKEMLSFKTIMVTGAGGSIGSELCRQIAYYRPKALILFEITELFLYQIENELKEKFADLQIHAIVGNIQNKSQVEAVIAKHKPQVIFHAAAYKHVPMMQFNAYEAVMNNIAGTLNVATAAKANHVGKMVLLSTDKAVNPINIMGATKRVCELICQGLQEKTGTHFMAVRFGNVLGSTGSVIPLFKRQIEAGGPVTVTHAQMTRYFMSIAEASQLVVQAAAIGKGGEIFVLDMGKPVPILNLAKDMIKLANLKLGVDIDIEFTGLRPGEKLQEELLTNAEATEATSHPGLRVTPITSTPENFWQQLDLLLEVTPSFANEEVQFRLKSLLEEYAPKDALPKSKAIELLEKVG